MFRHARDAHYVVAVSFSFLHIFFVSFVFAPCLSRFRLLAYRCSTFLLQTYSNVDDRLTESLREV